MQRAVLDVQEGRGTSGARCGPRRAERFLVVDDEPLVRQGLSRLLRHYGEVAFARTVAEGRALLAQPPWTAAILDLALPDGSGLDLLPEARAHLPLLPILVLSACIEHDAVNTAYEHRARYLVKPQTAAHVRLFIEDAVSVVPSVEALLRAWTARHRLTDAQADILRRAVLGEDRDAIPVSRGTTTLTFQSQVSALLFRVSHRSLQDAVARFLRELAGI